MNTHTPTLRAQNPLKKFEDLRVTADWQDRASVALARATTLWFNTGTLCNIECVNCYIDSSPSNDSLVYLSVEDVTRFLDQITERGWPVREIGFTGGEPFMNPHMIDLARLALGRGYEVLILTNAMQPMMRKRVKAGLQSLQAEFGDKLTLRVSLDHYSAAKNDSIRGEGCFDIAIRGMKFLRETGIQTTVAGRTLWNETEADVRAGFEHLFTRHGFAIDVSNPAELVLFPEMDETADVPEITTSCWGILGKKPDSVMCASSRMVVRRKGAENPVVLACTLLPYAEEFELGSTLAEAESDVFLNHRHCAKFCVLGGASCSA